MISSPTGSKLVARSIHVSLNVSITCAYEASEFETKRKIMSLQKESRIGHVMKIQSRQETEPKMHRGSGYIKVDEKIIVIVFRTPVVNGSKFCLHHPLHFFPVFLWEEALPCGLPFCPMEYSGLCNGSCYIAAVTDSE